MRILVAEDEQHLNKLITGKLQAEHYSVDACFNGQEALDYLAGAEYDVIIMDIMMPVLDGLSALQQLRSTGDKTPVLLLTARSGIDNRVAGLDTGADDYLTKPFSFDELLARICAAIPIKPATRSPLPISRWTVPPEPSPVQASPLLFQAGNLIFWNI